jgi:hypothetical protein
MNRKSADDSHRTPRWVKVFGAIALIVVVLAVIVALTGGDHGPGRHGPSIGGHTGPPEGVTHP